MSIIRIRKQRGYTAIPDATLRDPQFQSLRGLAALGLLVRLLSRPDGWEVRPGPLAFECGVGRDALRAMLALLGRIGYLVRRRSRNNQGRWDWESEVYDTPQSTIAGFSGDGKTAGGRAAVGEGGDKDNTDSSITDSSSTHHSSGGELVWPEQLTPSARTLCERELSRCPLQRRADVVRELAARLNRRDLKPVRLPQMWVRSLVAAAAADTLATFAPAAPLSAEQRAVVESEYQRRLRESRNSSARQLGLAGRSCS